MAIGNIVGGLARRKASLAPDFVLEVHQEKVERNGEDGYYYGVRDTACVMGVFDGGASLDTPRYERWQGKTGAYLSARALAGAARDWFVAGEGMLEADEAASRLKGCLLHYLRVCKTACGAGSAVREARAEELPAVCALVTYRAAEDGWEALSLWAGDARCYLLDARGLHQLSTDDVREADAMERLISGTAPTNAVNATGEFALHAHALPVQEPCVLLVATPGCFDALQTPMEFEYLLLRTLVGAESPIDWEDRLREAMASVATDDVTLCGLSVGYGSFAALKEAFRPRMQELYEGCVRGIAAKPVDEKWALWEHYKEGYYELA